MHACYSFGNPRGDLPMNYVTRRLADVGLRFVLLAAAAVSVSSAAATRSADEYPSKPVRVVVSASPGAVTDTQARLFSKLLSEKFKQQFIVDNRPGAGGLIGF